MLTPAAIAMSTYYKVGQNVTFGWNYTSLSNEPKAVDVYVTCTANNAAYTVANNMSFHSTAKVVWDTAPEKTGANPLLTSEYTLVIYDAAHDVSQAAAAGNLKAYSDVQFGMYTPQTYTGLKGTYPCGTQRVSGLTNDRWLEVCCLQWRHVRYGTTSPELHVWHVCHHDTFVYLVRRRRWPAVLRTTNSV